MSSVLSNIKNGNQFLSLEISEIKSGLMVTLLEVVKSRGELFVKNKENFEHWTEIESKLLKNKPLVLIYNTKKVLTKLVDTQKTKENEILNETFPNITLSDFYYMLTSESKQKLVSICRKDIIEEVMTSLESKGVKITDVFLGPTSIYAMLPFMDFDQFYISNYNIQKDESEIKSIVLLKEEEVGEIYSINGLQLRPKEILGFAGVFQWISNSTLYGSNLNESILKLQDDFVQFRRFNMLIKYGVSLLLLILVANFFVFNYYFSKNNRLSENEQVNQLQKDLLIKTEAIVKTKRERLNRIQMSTASQNSYYLDQIGKSIPASITLSTLRYQPLKVPLRPKKRIALDQNLMIIEGVLQDNEAFTKWVKLLETETWVESVEIKGYDFVDVKNSAFTLEISLKDGL